VDLCQSAAPIPRLQLESEIILPEALAPTRSRRVERSEGDRIMLPRPQRSVNPTDHAISMIEGIEEMAGYTRDGMRIVRITLCRTDDS